VKKDLDYDKFRYWLISTDLLEKEPANRNWKIERRNIDSYLYNRTPLGTSTGLRKIYILDDKQKNNFHSKIYIDFNKFLQKRLILTFMELNDNYFKTLITERSDNIKQKKFEELQKKMLLSFQSPNLIGAGNQSILNKYTDREHPIIKSPLILYIEPKKEEVLFNSHKKISINKVHKMIKMLKSIEGIYSIIDNSYIILPFLYYDFPWERCVFINTRKIWLDEKDSIHMPYLFDYIVKQFACYYWLNYRKNQLLQSDLLKFDPKKLNYNKANRDVSKSHEKVLLSLGQFYEYNIELLDELTLINDCNNTFADILQGRTIFEPYDNHIHPLNLKIRFLEGVTESLKTIEELIKKLAAKGLMISNFSRDMLNTRISAINLRLQWLLIFLTIILALLTGIFALKSF
jgi:hypothetical protein